MRTVFYANSAVFADNRRRVVVGKIDGLDDAGFGAFFTMNALFFVQYYAAAGSFRERACRAGVQASNIPGTRKAMRREKLAGYTAERAYFDGAFIVGK